MSSFITIRRGLAALATAAVAASGLAVVAPAAHANPAGTDLVISEVYGAGGDGGSVFASDFIELFNPTPSPIVLDGKYWVSYFSPAGGQGGLAGLTGTVPARAHWLIKASGAGSQTALPTPDSTVSINMRASGGRVFLQNTATTLGATSGSITADARIIDQVSESGSSSYEGAVGTVAGSATKSLQRKPDATRTYQDTDDTASDIIAAAPTPTNSTNNETAPAPLAIAPVSTVTGKTDRALTATQIVATGGAGDYTFALTDGILPAGLTLSATGLLAGTPTEVYDDTVTVTATDSAGATASASFDITIADSNEPLTLPSPGDRTATKGTALPPITLAAEGGTEPYTYARTAGTLPAGLTFSGTTISGTPTTVTTAPVSLTFTAADSLGATATVSFTISVGEATAGTEPKDYYKSADGLTGEPLEDELHKIVAPHTAYSYAALWDLLAVTDRDPNNPNNVIEVYSGRSIAASNHGGSTGQWNREHSWAKSHGDFGESTGPGTDLFHMRPEDVSTNSSRSNKDFNDGGAANVPNCSQCHSTSQTFEPRPEIKGDVARGIFYMSVAYDGTTDNGAYSGDDAFPDLQLAESDDTGTDPRMGRLSTLLTWSAEDPPDALERARNDVIFRDYQHNRNPFIDHPEYAAALWSGGPGVVTGGDSDPDPEPTAVLATTPVTLTGDVTVGSTVTAHAPTWNVDGVTTAYHWFRGTGEDRVEIPVADTSSPDLALTAADYGTQISVEARGTKGGLADGVSTGGPVTVGKGAAPTVTATPASPTGAAQVGSVLTAPEAPQWSRPVTRTDLAWLVDGQPVSGEVSTTYTVRASDVGKTVAVRFTGIDPAYADGIVTSAPTAPITEVSTPPGGTAVLAETDATVTGSGRVDDTLTAHAPTWNVSPVTVEYHWFYGAGDDRTEIAVEDVTSPDYVVQPGDVGREISVTVRGTKAGLTPGSSTSGSVLVTKGASPTAVSTPAAPAGTAQVGSVLTAPADPDWTRPMAATSHVWLVGGQPVTGETGPTYTVRPGDLGSTIAVLFTSAGTAYDDGIVTSAATAPVVAAPVPQQPQTPALGTVGNPAPVTASVVPAKVKAKRFAITFTAPGAPASAVTGVVKVYDGKRLLGTFRVVNGRAVIKPRKRLAKGRHRLRLVLPATATSRAYTRTVKVRVK